MRGVAGLFALLLLGLWIHADYRSSLDRPLPIRQSERLMVHKGQGLAAVAQELRQRRIVVEPVWLRLLAATRGVSGDLKFGEYEIPPGTTARGLLDMLVSGRSRQEPVTIIEGWTFRQMREALARHPNLRQETAGRTAEDIMALLGSPGLLPEGQFFPDTYFTGRHTSDLDILRQAHRKMRAILAAEWQDRAPNLPLNSPEEALTLASIVEKETGQASERPAIAGVFVRRLLQGMRLQTDPTVIYGIENYDGNIRRRDLRTDTPYNTYTRAGLPPTPIALPGLESLQAVVQPEKTDKVFFVATGEPDGSHYFSATLAEHEAAVQRYLKRLRERSQ